MYQITCGINVYSHPIIASSISNQLQGANYAISFYQLFLSKHNSHSEGIPTTNKMRMRHKIMTNDKVEISWRN